MENSFWLGRRFCALVTGLAVALTLALTGAAASASEGYGKKKYWFYPLGDLIEVESISDVVIPFKSIGQIPARPALIGEIGDPFLDTGPLDPGFEVPLLGAVWQPRLWSYFIYRTTVQTFDNGVRDRESEWANRMDWFFNLQLTGTEKIILGLRPLDKNEPGRFTSYGFEGQREDFVNELNNDVETLFFEGDIGSLFPGLDPGGFKAIDFGFTVGRQPIVFQEGILINDTVDAVGFIRNNMYFPGASNFRVSAMYAWDRLDRNADTRPGTDPEMYGVFAAADMQVSTFNLDVIYVDDDLDTGDSVNIGFAAIQRFGLIATAFRANTSITNDDEIAGTVANGTLLSAEISWHPPASHDIVYINPYWAIDNYTQAGREAVVGGPLAALGILSASPNLSNYGAEINPFTNEVAGAAIGYQAFFDHNRRNLALEIAGRKDTSGIGNDDIGLGFQLQQAIGQNYQFQIEGFYTAQENRGDASGARVEFLVVY